MGNEKKSWGDQVEGLDTTAKKGWGDQVGDELGDELPPPKVIGPDANGVKTVIEYYMEDGKRVKLTRKIKTKTVKTKLHHSEAARRAWKKFGAAARDGDGPNLSTTKIGEPVPLKLGIRTAQSMAAEEEVDQNQALKKPKVVVCRYCKGEHWSLKCPYKSSFKNVDEDNAPPPPTEEDDAPKQDQSEDTKGKYVPPSLRNKDGGERKGEKMGGSRDRDDNTTVMVTNLSQDASEKDLRELFGRFGAIARIFLAKDKNTGVSKGFAFVNYQTMESAAKAIKRVDGFGYDNLILHVDWAKPNTK